MTVIYVCSFIALALLLLTWIRGRDDTGDRDWDGFEDDGP